MKDDNYAKHDKTLRILLLSNMYPSEKTPSYGIFVKNIYMQLLEAGIDIDKCVIEGQRSTKVGKLLAYAIYIVKSLFRLLFTRRTIYIHFVAHTSFPVLILSLFRRFNIVAHVHGGDVMFQPKVSKSWTSIKTKMAEKTLRLSKRIIVPSHYFSDFIQQKFDVDAQAVFVSPSGGIDTNHFVPVSRKSNSVIKLGYVGRIDPGKGVYTLLQAMKLLSDKNEKVELAIVGTGRESEQMRQYTLNNGLSKICQFVGGSAQHELVNYYQSFDYFVFPTELNESLGLVGLEAMSCGIPIITSGQAGISDYFADKVNGFKYRSGDHNSLSEVISNLPSVDSSVYQKMAEECRLTALEFDSVLVKHKLIDDFKKS